jgi:hypothetical protein
MKHIDKLYHFFAGILIYIFFDVLFDIWNIIPVIIIGGLKEIYDRYSGKGTPDWWDFIWTIMGGIVAFLILN